MSDDIFDFWPDGVQVNRPKSILHIDAFEFPFDGLIDDTVYPTINESWTGPVQILTRSLGEGCDYGDMPPALFETMIFWPGNDRFHHWRRSYWTRKDASQGHSTIYRFIKEAVRGVPAAISKAWWNCR
jgi:hypothetical protein